MVEESHYDYRSEFAPAPRQSLSIGVVLPVAEDTPVFRQALDALAAATPRADDVVIVCDGPVSSAARAARQHGFRVVECASRRGPAAARNAGVRAIETDVVFFVDADVAIRPAAVGRVRDVLADDAIAAVVGCYDAAPPESNFFSLYKNLLQRAVHLDARADGSTFWGACGAVRRRAFAAVGGFDERFEKPSVEDIDLGYRLSAAGFRIRFDPSLEITHLKRWTLTSLVRSDVARRAVPWTWLLLRERAAAPDLNLRYSSRIAGALSWLAIAAFVVGAFEPRAWWLAGAALASLAWIDRRLWTFFRTARGAVFASAAILWHWVYYAYSALGFALGVVTYPIVGARMVSDRGAASMKPRPGTRPRR
jgi:GT2 family glycosyltransferase